MVNYKCDYCGVYFDTPNVVHHSETLGDGWVRGYNEELCPICGSDSFQDATTCPQCEEPMLAHRQHLCDKCRTSLKERFTAFADELTAEEEQQIDDWMDGDSITNRRNWT